MLRQMFWLGQCLGHCLGRGRALGNSKLDRVILLGVAMLAGGLAAYSNRAFAQAEQTAQTSKVHAFDPSDPGDPGSLGLPHQSEMPARPLARRVIVQIASWNISADIKANKRAAAHKSGGTSSNPARQWRNTFGAERDTATWRKRGAAGFDADVVFLQGVDTVNDARRLFGANTHHLIVSRQILLISPKVSAGDGGVGAGPIGPDGITAIAIRRRARLLLTRRRHFLPKFIIDQRRDPTTFAGRLPAAPVAVRLLMRGHLVWFVSAEIDGSCAQAGSTMDTRERHQKTGGAKLGQPGSGVDCVLQRVLVSKLTDWIGKQRKAGMRIVLGGSFARDFLSQNVLKGKLLKKHSIEAVRSARAAIPGGKTGKPIKCPVSTPALVALPGLQQGLLGHDGVYGIALNDAMSPKGRACVLSAKLTIGATE